MKRSLCLASLAVPCVVLLAPFVTSEVGAQSAIVDDRVADALSGIVRDSTGAVISRATVTLRLEPAGLARVITGRADGTFSLAKTAAGRYSCSRFRCRDMFCPLWVSQCVLSTLDKSETSDVPYARLPAAGRRHQSFTRYRDASTDFSCIGDTGIRRRASCASAIGRWYICRSAFRSADDGEAGTPDSWRSSRRLQPGGRGAGRRIRLYAVRNQQPRVAEARRL